MEKMKDSYGKGKKSNEEFVEGEEHEEMDYDNGYDAVVDEMLESIESKDTSNKDQNTDPNKQ